MAPRPKGRVFTALSRTNLLEAGGASQLVTPTKCLSFPRPLEGISTGTPRNGVAVPLKAPNTPTEKPGFFNADACVQGLTSSGVSFGIPARLTVFARVGFMTSVAQSRPFHLLVFTDCFIFGHKQVIFISGGLVTRY